jgi:hypothetical protein
MPGNWDSTQRLNTGTGRVEWPTGPYNIGAFAGTWVDAWVVQDPAVPFPWPHLDLPGPSQSAHGSAFTATKWKADNSGWHNGNLAAGPALGIALMAMRDPAGHYEFDWWFDIVTLVPIP